MMVMFQLLEPPASAEKTHGENVDLKFVLIVVQKHLKTENGCDTCMACGYSKCDK